MVSRLIRLSRFGDYVHFAHGSIPFCLYGVSAVILLEVDSTLASDQLFCLFGTVYLL